jgi:gamma-glutamyltranspeptidase/glutathione hydrolase
MTSMLRSRFLACVSSLLLLSACSIDLSGSLGLNSGTSGGSGARAGSLVVGDEPFAIRSGAAILSQGGSAVDAVTAAYFTLAVTYPAAAGLGGGGICIVHDATTGRNEEFDFLARDAGGGGAYAVPGNVRGFALMQSVYGTLPWQRDVSPGEGYAATGFLISRTLAARLKSSQDLIRLDAGLAAEFMDESGATKPEGSTVSNPELAQTIAALRVNGPNGFYKGAVGARLIAYSQAQGGTIAVTDFDGYNASRGAPQSTQVRNALVYFPSQRTGAGAFAGNLFDELNRALASNAGSGDLQTSVLYAVKQTLTKYAITSLPGDLGATGFAAIDRNGQAAACAVTMNGPFGSGHTAPGTGVTLARAPSAGQAGLAAAFLTPVIATESGSTSVSLVGAGAGGPNGTAMIGYALAQLANGEGLATSADMHSTGVSFDTVNAIGCQNGACVALPDPAANGSGASGDAPH